MSQSPTNPNATQSLTRYRQGWKALNRLLHEERSFSGDEKNCAFLSMGQGKFASISSVSGLDYNDDSRALAICDWDFDGQLDLWQTARTAPRVRLLHNQGTTAGNFIAIQLRGNGTSTNRDAIGARIEVLSDGKLKSIRTLHAGDGFLTQSSRWIHFGLGKNEKIRGVRVSWPGDTARSYDITAPNKFYVIDQQSAATSVWQPPTGRRKLTPSKQSVARSSAIARIIPPYRLPLPVVNYVTGADATQQELEVFQPTVLTVWSATCPNCQSELKEWGAANSEFLSAGLDVIALNADIGSSPAEVEQQRELLKKLGVTFQNFSATPEALRRLDFFQRALMDLWQPMPVPCSFLLDHLGHVVAIYKGPVDAKQIIDDVQLFKATPDQLREAAVPFAGIWGMRAPQADPSRVASQMVDHTLLADATDYLKRFLDSVKQSGTSIGKARQADIQYMRSVLLGSLKEPAKALEALEASRDLNPTDVRIRLDLARTYQTANRLADAEQELIAAVSINPRSTAIRRQLVSCLQRQEKFDASLQQLAQLLKFNPRDAVSHFHAGTAYRSRGEWKAAITSYSRAAELQPSFLLASNNVAWILATHPDREIRDGRRAVEIAQKLCSQTGMRQPNFLDTLAASYAEIGDFEKAVAAIRKAIQLAKTGDTSQMIVRQRLYQQQTPYRAKSAASTRSSQP